MKTYIYPQNLKATANIWLWGLKEFCVIAIVGLVSIFLLVKYSFVIPFALTLGYAFLTIRVDEITILDFIKYAGRYLITTQQYFEWR
jgi:hypothetical protein